jgi:hypothetical protein
LDLLEKDFKEILGYFQPSQPGDERVSKGKDFWGEVISSVAILLDESEFSQRITKTRRRRVVRPQSLGNFRKGERMSSLSKGSENGQALC